jgi:hypothetical protein
VASNSTRTKTIHRVSAASPGKRGHAKKQAGTGREKEGNDGDGNLHRTAKAKRQLKLSEQLGSCRV